MPTHLIDTVGSAANSTRDAAGELLHDAVSAVRRRRRRPNPRIRTAAVAGVALAVVVLLLVRRPFGSAGSGRRNTVKSADHTIDGHTTTSERNGTMTQHSDDLKGRIKEAAGVLSDNDDLQTEGKRDQQAAKAKQAVDKASDAITDGIDAVKEKLTKS